VRRPPPKPQARPRIADSCSRQPGTDIRWPAILVHRCLANWAFPRPGAPRGFLKLVGRWPPGLERLARLTGQLDYIHLFASERRVLEALFPKARAVLGKQGTLWVSWPKKASGEATDLSEPVVRELGLATGLVDVKVCAVDDTWSGLKFMWRLKDR
jgi:hypothetical protein